jgi:SAM-dependent MidA family methyltransferase
MDYTIVEISPIMANRQRQRVLSQHPNCRVLNADILTWSDQFPPTSDNCFFIAMEVLDNLPHDKVAIRNGKWYETVIVVSEYPDGSRHIEERKRPLQDQLIIQTLQYFGCDLPLKVQRKYDNR